METEQKARELLVEAIGRPVDFLDALGDGFCITKDEALRAIAHALAQQPQGYVPVPVQPTQGILNVLYRTRSGFGDDYILREDAEKIWADLLAAAFKQRAA